MPDLSSPRPVLDLGRGHPAGHRSRRRSLLSASLVLGVPAIAYLAARPIVGSDTVALAIAGALPLGYDIVLVVWRHRINPWAVLSAIGFALGCLASVLAGGSSLPLKLHEAAVTFVLGLVLLGAVLIRRPVSMGAVLRVPGADRRLDATLSVMVGGFLISHALLHVILAVRLSTPTYVVAGRIVNWATIALGGAALYAYLRRVRRRAPDHRGATG